MLAGVEKNEHASKAKEGIQGRSTKEKSSSAGIRLGADRRVRVKATEAIKSEAS